MYPHERSLVQKLEDEPFVLLGVNSDDAPEKVAEVRERERITWPSFFDGGGTGGPIAVRWGVRAWPTIYVIDHRGVIRYRNVRGPRLDAAIEELLAKAKAAEGAKER